MSGERLQLLDVWQKGPTILRYCPREEVLFHPFHFSVYPALQAVIDFALAIILFVVPIQLLSSRIFLLHIAGSYFAKAGKDLEWEVYQ